MRTILVVEPHAPTLALLAEQLHVAGYRVVCASDGPSGYELYLQVHPHAVLLAVDLPRIGDLSPGRRMRASAGGERVPLIAIDGGHHGRTLGVTAVLDAHPDAYVADPTRPGLLEKVRELATKVAETDGIAQVLARPPELSGALDPTALAAQLVMIDRQRRSGVLVARSRNVERRLHLLDGHVIGFESTVRAETPVRWLHGTGRLSAEQAGAVLAAMAAEGSGVGQAMVESGAMDAAAMAACLRDRHRAGAALVVGMREGRYQLHGGREHAASPESAAVPVGACLLEAARHTLTLRYCARALSPFLARYPRISGAFEGEARAMGLCAEELGWAGLLDASATLREVLAEGRGELRQRYGLYYALQLCGLIDHLDAPATSPRITPSRGAQLLPADQVERLRESALRALTGSYFQVLGLSIAATDDEVERAYRQVAARFNPDVYAEYELGELQELLMTLQERIDAAYSVLSSAAKRRSYLEHVLRRLEPISRSAAVNTEAEVELQRGISVMEADPRAAAASFERAVSQSPKEPAYYAYLAWARFRGAALGSPDERARDAMRVIRKGLAARPDDDRLIAILGILEAEAGNPAEARRHLAQALRINEGNRLARAALRRLNRLPV